MWSKYSLRLVLAALALLSPGTAALALPPAPDPAPFVETWALLGTFGSEAPPGLSAARIAPAVGQQQAGRTWEYFDDRLFIRNRDDYQDLLSYYAVKKHEEDEHRTAYAHTYVFSPGARPAVLYVGSQGGFRAWVNGAPVGSFIGDRLARRDETSCPVTLRAGWNRVLLELTGGTGAWGFYARLGDAQKDALPGLVASIGGGAGPLAVTTSALPPGYLGQAYVALDVPEASNINNAHASPFCLEAQGGSAPYAWAVAAGRLPLGLALSPAGALTGTPTSAGQFSFTLRVTDHAGHSARRAFTLAVTQAPSSAFAFSRLVADVNPDRGELRAGVVLPLLKRAGFGYCYVGAVHDAVPDWDAPGFSHQPDYVTPYAEATRQSGLRFGVYVSLYNADMTRPAGFTGTDWRMALVRDIIRRWNPDLYWFDEINRGSQNDWKTGLDANREWDALHSYIRACNPNAVILMNDGTESRDGRGDIDVLEMEGTRGGYWGHWPVPYPAAPSLPVDSWRYIGEGGLMDWAEWMRDTVSLIGEGRIADLPWDTESRVKGSLALFGKVADWINPPGLPSKVPALVDTVPVPSLSGGWGYAVRSRSRDALYLYLLSTPRGKAGLPASGNLALNVPQAAIASARVLNSGKPVTVTPAGAGVRLDLRSVRADPVATIVEVRFSSGKSF